MVTLPFPCPKHALQNAPQTGNCSVIFAHENMLKIWRSDPWTCSGSAETWPQEFWALEPVRMRPQAVYPLSDLLLRFLAPAASASVSQWWRWFLRFAWLSRVQGGGLPSGLSSLMVLRKIISLYLVHLFSCDNESDNFRALSISEAGAEVFPCFPVKRSLMSWNPLAPQSLPWEQPCSSPVSPAAVISALGASLAFLDSSQHIFWFTSSFYYSLFPQLSNERNMGNKFSKSVSKYIF